MKWSQIISPRLLMTALLSCALTLSAATARATDDRSVKVKSGLATPVMEAGRQQNAYLRVSLTGFEIDKGMERPDLNVAIVLDQSSSMSGDKIERAKDAAILAVSKLSSSDIVSIVTYDSSVNVLVPATKVRNKNKLYNAIRSIRANGSTALFAGTSKGAHEVRKFLDKERVNRVVLLSDGMANIGPDSPSELGQLGKALAKEGMSVSTIGLGLGYNEDLMTQLANYSDGNHDFVENSADLARVFDREFGEAMSVVAQDVEIEIICREGVRPIRIIGRDGTIIGQRVITRMNQLYSAQENYVVLEVEVPVGSADSERDVADVAVNYNNMATSQRDRAKDLVVVNYTSSPELVRQSIDRDAYEGAIEQVANANAVEALELRDKGDVAGASETLKSNASFLDRAADLISSPLLRQQSQESLEESIAVEKEEEWAKNRKALKAKAYKRTKQQEKSSDYE